MDDTASDFPPCHAHHTLILMRRAVVIGGVAALTLAGGAAWYVLRTINSPLDLRAPPPAIGPDLPDEAPPALLSVIDAPIAYDLSPAVAALESVVPRNFGDLTNRMQAGSNRRVKIAFAASRAPFTVRIDSLRVTISTIVEYEGRGWYKPVIGPEVSAACGTSGVPRPRIRVSLVSNTALTPDWTLRARTRLATLEPVSAENRDKCRVTVFRVDVTPRILTAVRSLLEQQLASIDRSIARIDTRKRFEGWWRRMQLPIRLADSIYLTLNPRSAALGSVTRDSSTLIANVRLTVEPRVITGPRPNDFTLINAIPLLGNPVRETTRGLRVMLDGSFTYPVATSLLRQALVGRTVTQAGRTITISDVRLSGIGGGKIALGVDLRGAARGTVYFTGTPAVDTLNRQVFVPDLDYDAGSLNVLVKGLEFLRGDDLRKLLRARARLPDSDVIGRLSDLAERGMNRTLTEGVELKASIQEARGVRVRATTKDISVRAVATGEARLAISREIKVPRRVANPLKDQPTIP